MGTHLRIGTAVRVKVVADSVESQIESGNGVQIFHYERRGCRRMVVGRGRRNQGRWLPFHCAFLVLCDGTTIRCYVSRTSCWQGQEKGRRHFYAEIPPSVLICSISSYFHSLDYYYYYYWGRMHRVTNKDIFGNDYPGHCYTNERRRVGIKMMSTNRYWTTRVPMGVYEFLRIKGWFNV